MDKQLKKLLIGDTIKLFIGLILLGFSLNYISYHPAEKEALISGFEMIKEKADIFWHKIFYRDDSYLKKKITMQKYIYELWKLSKNKCQNLDISKDIFNLYQKVQKVSVEEFKNNIEEYTRLLFKYDNLVKENCN